jgi:hypothetical protein
MALKSEIPKSAKLAVIGGIFKATLNAPTIGYFDFTLNGMPLGRNNTSVKLGLNMSGNYLYFFHKMNFSLSCDEGTFLSAIKTGTVPTLTVRESTSRNNIFYAPMRLFRYMENQAIDSYHLNQNNLSEFVADFQAILIMVPDLVGISNLYAQVSFDVYEITDNDFIMDYKRQINK